jgi:fibronectin type 3 domain-containing protein
MPNKILLIRQGDVILRSVEEIPQDAEQVAKRMEFGSTVLEPEKIMVRGETGHTHVLEGVKPFINRIRGEVYVEVTIPTTLKHEEHPNVNVEPGKYIVYTVQDFVRGRRPLD